MNGLALMASVITHVVVAKTKSTLFTGPSGASAHSSVENTASASSVAMPALAMTSCFLRSASFQVSPVSVYRNGHMTRNATPMVGTRTP